MALLARLALFTAIWVPCLHEGHVIWDRRKRARFSFSEDCVLLCLRVLVSDGHWLEGFQFYEGLDSVQTLVKSFARLRREAISKVVMRNQYSNFDVNISVHAVTILKRTLRIVYLVAVTSKELPQHYTFAFESCSPIPNTLGAGLTCFYIYPSPHALPRIPTSNFATLAYSMTIPHTEST